MWMTPNIIRNNQLNRWINYGEEQEEEIKPIQTNSSKETVKGRERTTQKGNEILK